MSTPPDQSRPPPILGCFLRLSSFSLIAGSLGIGAIGWFVLATMADSIRKNPGEIGPLPAVAAACIDYRNWLPLLVVPTLLCGILLMIRRRSGPLGWPAFVMAFGWLMMLFGLILYSFIMFITPLYQYHPL